MTRATLFKHASERPGAVGRRIRLTGALVATAAVAGAGLALVSPTAQAAATEETFFGTAQPQVVSDQDTAAVELGVRFRPVVAGSITGVRFYKGATNTGTHTGSLWSSTGSKLAGATFTNETTSGWQSVRFAKPVAVAANTTYVASYLAPRGRYAADQYYFNTSRRVGNLHAGATNNGVYRYGGGFPTQNYRATNYYVDVLFVAGTTTAPAPTTPPPTTTPTTPPPTTAPTTPPPTTAPTTPPPTTTAPATTTYGWQLTAAKTGLSGAGIDRNTLPTFTGTVTSGMTLSRVKITSPLDLTSKSNVTLDRVWLAPTSGRQALVLGVGTTIKDSDIDGARMPIAERDGIYGNGPGNYTISRVSITGMTVGAWLDGGGPGAGTMSDTYIGAMVSNGGQHMDGFTRRHGTGALAITRSRIDTTGSSVTGAFFLQNTWGGQIAGITVKDTYLQGDGYVLTLENKGAGTSVGFDNVRISATGWGPVTATPMSGNGPGAITYTSWNNVRTYDGNRLPSADGAVLNHP